MHSYQTSWDFQIGPHHQLVHCDALLKMGGKYDFFFPKKLQSIQKKLTQIIIILYYQSL